jgi:hypothetical protein
MATKLPQTVYVYRYDEDGNDGPLTIETELIQCGSQDGPRLVGIYELKEVVEVELVVKTKSASNEDDGVPF